jgi:POT family proton-dependent oligopeptide transporter
MLAGLFTYQVLRPRYLPGVGLPPGARVAATAAAFAGDPAPDPPRRVVWQRIGVILVLAFVGNIFFWTAFEQAGSSLNVFAEQSTDRSLGGLFAGEGFPATWYQSVNPLAILLFAPVFAWLWPALDRRGRNPSTPAKFAWGLFLQGLAFVAMVFGAIEARDGRLAGPHWLFATYVLATWGELCLSPVGLSMVTKLAPARLQSLLMGLWFFSLALGNLFGGLAARFSRRLEAGEIEFVIEGLPGFFLLLVVAPIAAGLFLLLLAPLLRRMMHGVN